MMRKLIVSTSSTTPDEYLSYRKNQKIIFFSHKITLQVPVTMAERFSHSAVREERPANRQDSFFSKIWFPKKICNILLQKSSPLPIAVHLDLKGGLYGKRTEVVKKSLSFPTYDRREDPSSGKVPAWVSEKDSPPTFVITRKNPEKEQGGENNENMSPQSLKELEEFLELQIQMHQTCPESSGEEFNEIPDDVYESYHSIVFLPH